jgi:hypothetical protein
VQIVRLVCVASATALFVAGCGGSSRSGAIGGVPGTTSSQYSQRFPGIKLAGRMPAPLTLPARLTARQPQIDVPGSVETVPMPIPGSALAALPHTVSPATPVPTATPAPTPTPHVPPTKPPCTKTCPQSTERTPLNTVNTADNGGQAGYILNPGSANGVGDVFVAMVALNDVSMNPSQTGGYNLLYGPTTHGPNGNCLELSTDYYNGYGSTGTISQVQIWDFCASGWAGAIPMDASFFDKYVRVYSNGNGMPQYIAEMAEGPDTKWHAYLFNNNNGLYDDIYQSSAGAVSNVLNGEGWNIFETHYSVGTCSTIPTTGESGLRIHDSNTSHANWYYPGAYYTYSYGDCFPSGGVVSPYYTINYAPTPDMSWLVNTN